MSKNVIDFFIIGSAIQKNLYLTLLDGIKTSKEVIDHVSDPEVFKLIYFLSTDNALAREIKSELINKWIVLYENLKREGEHPDLDLASLKWYFYASLTSMADFDVETCSPLMLADVMVNLNKNESAEYALKLRKVMIDARHVLFTAIDEKAPFVQLKFYDKYKKAILMYDVWFQNFLIKQTKAKADANDAFKPIYNALIQDVKNTQKYCMYMN